MKEIKKLTIIAEYGDEPKRVPKKDRVVKGEIMMTSGPRKTDDYPLGEDAAGIVLYGEHAAFWVADGTSESPRLLGFSSRSMAQEIGASFVEVHNRLRKARLKRAVDRGWNVSSIILKKSGRVLRDDWQQRLDEYLRDSDYRELIRDAFRISEETSKLVNRTHYDFIDFTTTVMCGMVTNRGAGQVACIGNPSLCVRTGGEMKVYRLSNNKFFLRLRRNDGAYSFDELVTHEVATTQFCGADLVVAGTDGVGRLPEIMSGQAQKISWQDIRKRIHQFSPGKDDDKTFCIIQLMDE